MTLSRRLALSILSVGFLLGTFLSPHTTLAVTLQEQISQQIDTGAEKAGFVQDAKDPRELIAQIIGIALTFVGTIFLVLLAISGYWLFTARGEEEKVEKAKKTIRYCIVGLAIVLVSYSITLFVGKIILDAQTGEAPAAQGVRSRGNVLPWNWD